MSANTKIEWADATVNWWAGCTAISPACDNCYAKRMAGRLWGTQWGPGEVRTQFTGPAKALRALDRKAKRLGMPLRVFHNSMSDFFDNEVPDEWREAAFEAMAGTPNLIHLLLTKRIGNVGNMLPVPFDFDRLYPNVWLGATVVNQEEADRDVPKLLQVPAAKRFLSMEPLLGPVGLRWTPYAHQATGETYRQYLERNNEVNEYEALRKLDWVIVGGESGPGARPMHPDWSASLHKQCHAAGVPFFFKQWGEWMPESAMNLAQRMRDCGQYECLYTKLDGSTHWIDKDDHTPFAASDVRMVKVGKKAAGRLLDGRTWDEVPTC